MPDDNLGDPVLVTFPDGTGSGFYLNANKGLFLVSAKHVLFGKDQKPRSGTVQLLSYPKNPSDAEPVHVVLDLDMLQKSGNIKAHDTQDVAVVKIATTEPGDLPPAYKVITLPGVSGTGGSPVTVGENAVLLLDHVLVGNDVLVFGYPNSLGLQEQPQFDPMHPLLRKGIVAGLNQYRKGIVLDCPVYYGNSGGPVIQVDTVSAFEKRFSVIGVVGEFIPFVERAQTYMHLLNSGYSVAAPMDAVMDLVKSM
jgi:hypothetical protein